MTPSEAGVNAARMMLYYSIIRAQPGGRTSRAIQHLLLLLRCDQTETALLTATRTTTLFHRKREVMDTALEEYPRALL